MTSPNLPNMALHHDSCAFSTSLLLPSRLPSHSLTTPLAQRPPFCPTPLTAHPRSTISTIKRRRPTAAAYDNRNQNGENVSSQIADALIGAGRFLQSPTGQLVLWAGLAWLVFTGRIGMLLDSFLVLFAVLTIVPVLAVVGFRWWINRQLVQGTCPSCGAQVTGLRNQAFKCMTCGNTVMGERGDFSVKDPSSATIDIDAKEIDNY